MQNYNYPNIDMQRTGALIKKKVEGAGYTVKELQEKLMLTFVGQEMQFIP